MEGGATDGQTSGGNQSQTKHEETDKHKIMARADWDTVWNSGATHFHRKEVHDMLSKHIDQLIAGRSNVKCFVPLCGKSVDMKWLYDLGHSVVGVEFSAQGIEEFFAEQGLEYTVSSCDPVEGKCYQTADGRIKLYCCDIYNFNNSIEGKFDAMWDRGSFVAINKGDRQKYADLMKSLMAKDCRLLLDSFEYNPMQYAGPPHHVPEYEIYNCFEDRCQIERLEFVLAMTEKQKKWGVDSFYEKVHLLMARN